MPRLIDANALMDDVEMDGALYACLGAVEDVRFLVDSQPTVDAVEVVHGRWTQNDIYYEEENVYICTNCEFALQLMVETPVENRYNYCPNCGAKMDGDGNEQ